MQRIDVAIIGGGASGLFLARLLAAYNAAHENKIQFTLIERNERLGKKLSATGNGQGNVTNLAASETEYFSSENAAALRAQKLIGKYTQTEFEKFWAELGVPLVYDERGRAYPAGRQASALTDALRFYLAEQGADIRLQTRVTALEKQGGGFVLRCQREEKEDVLFAKAVVLCVGGKAAKNFGTDGTGYALAQGLGHTCTPLYPSLVQLKTDVVHTKTLKGIRVNDGKLTACAGGKEVSLRGDIIFTDYGVSGDAVFRVSAFLADKIGKTDVSLAIDFLPELSLEQIENALRAKKQNFPSLPTGELLFGIVNNQVGRAVAKRVDGDLKKAASLIKNFTLSVTGSLGFDYAQVTKGGIPLSETNDNLQSRLHKGLYFAGEILDVDGACGGFNLQWAYSSACAVADALCGKI